jgi:poly(A) polymerase
LLEALARLARSQPRGLWISGGAVRDLLLNRSCQDLDITVVAGGVTCAGRLARETGGAFVLLDAEEDVARVVWQGITVDCAAFREKAVTIEEDLAKRDFTINALAVPFDPARPALVRAGGIIDPTGGLADLRQRLVRSTSAEVFGNDPLRLLRAYRFMATLGFALEGGTEKQIRDHGALLPEAAAERLSHELTLLMGSGRGAAILERMAASTLLWRIFPELQAGVGMAQPASHHLDVFSHGLAALRAMEEMQRRPEQWFPGRGAAMEAYLAGAGRRLRLRWAALFHDLGKPASFRRRGEGEGRITFYNHDHAGASLFEAIAARLHWSREDTVRISRFIALHMWPFHLSNARFRTKLTPRACLRLAKAIRDDLPGLFLLAMADSLAGRGPKRPVDMEMAVFELYREVMRVYSERIEPVLERPRLLTGHDLIKECGLKPGPLFSRILDGLEQAAVEGEVRDREEALRWVRRFLEEQGPA